MPYKAATFFQRSALLVALLQVYFRQAELCEHKNIVQVTTTIALNSIVFFMSMKALETAGSYNREFTTSTTRMRSFCSNSTELGRLNPDSEIFFETGNRVSQSGMK